MRTCLPRSHTSQVRCLSRGPRRRRCDAHQRERACRIRTNPHTSPRRHHPVAPLRPEDVVCRPASRRNPRWEAGRAKDFPRSSSSRGSGAPSRQAPVGPGNSRRGSGRKGLLSAPASAPNPAPNVVSWGCIGRDRSGAARAQPCVPLALVAVDATGRDAGWSLKIRRPQGLTSSSLVSGTRSRSRVSRRRTGRNAHAVFSGGLVLRYLLPL